MDRIEKRLETTGSGHGRKEGQKLKPYLVMQYLLRHTDADRCVSAEEIVTYLQNICGIYAERRSIYRDIREINKASLMLSRGISIQEAEKQLASDAEQKLIVYDGSRKGFHINAARRAVSDDIRLLAECVASSRFIREEQAAQLTGVLAALGGAERDAPLCCAAVVTDRIRVDQQRLLSNLDILFDALNRTKISFRSLEYTLQEGGRSPKLQSGELRVFSPNRLFISDARYYLLGFDEVKRALCVCRVDRMTDICVLNELPEETDAAELDRYAQQGGEATLIRMIFTNDLLDTVADRFGTEGAQYIRAGDEHFEFFAEAVTDEAFFLWLCSLGKKAKIVAPNTVIEQFKCFLDRSGDLY